MNKKSIITAALVIAVAGVLPQVASAAWWNPFSWFKRATPAVEVSVTATSTVATTSVSVIATTTPLETGKKPAPAQKPVSTPPASQKPATNPSTQKPAPTSVTNPVAKPSSNASATTTASVTAGNKSATATATAEVKNEPKIDVPAYAVDTYYTPSVFVYPRVVKNGQVLLVANPVRGSEANALGNWYVDSVTWKIVSDSLRSGDLTVSISAGQSWIEDSADINTSHTTKLTAHVASDPLIFTINGQVPGKGAFRVVVEEIKGHMKADASAKTYVFGGTPLSGPEFTI